MSDMAFVFVILPCIAAILAGALLFDWRLAVAALCGALGMVLLAPSLPPQFGYVGLPVFAGIALGALAVAVGLWRRPSLDIWARMICALLVAFFATFLNLITFSTGA